MGNGTLVPGCSRAMQSAEHAGLTKPWSLGKTPGAPGAQSDAMERKYSGTPTGSEDRAGQRGCGIET